MAHGVQLVRTPLAGLAFMSPPGRHWALVVPGPTGSRVKPMAVSPGDRAARQEQVVTTSSLLQERQTMEPRSRAHSRREGGWALEAVTDMNKVPGAVFPTGLSQGPHCPHPHPNSPRGRSHSWEMGRRGDGRGWGERHHSQLSLAAVAPPQKHAGGTLSQVSSVEVRASVSCCFHHPSLSHCGPRLSFCHIKSHLT